MRVILGCVLVLLICPPMVRGQTIQGRLVEALTDRSVRFGELVVLSEEGEVLERTLSSATGTFSLPDLPEVDGPYLLRARAMGYRRKALWIDVNDQDTLTVSIQLEVEPVYVDSLTAEVARRRSPLVENGFLERMNRGRGEFVTPRWIQEKDPADLRRTFQMLPRAYMRHRRVDGIRRRTVVLKDGRHECLPAIFVDGLRVPKGIALDQLGVPIEDLQAMEVYRDPTAAPPRYGGGLMRGMGGACGVVLIWTWAQN